MGVVNHRAQTIWKKYREQILYLVVGAWNTLFQYATFSLFYYLLHARLYPSLILFLSYFVSSINGFFGYRRIVFRSSGHPVAEYIKFQFVYGPLLAVNLVVLPVALKYTSVNAYAIQALFGAFAIVFSYVGNKYFAFRLPKQEAPAAEREAQSPIRRRRR
jgi:putative flippase GtrA